MVSPLVSVGLPTYSRPELLERAIVGLRHQTYTNIEIVISDNASPGPEVAAVVAAHVASDSRVRYVRQPKTIQPFHNFIEVLQMSRGEFFMWAADDDYREDWFIERALSVFDREPRTALVAAEAQYFRHGVEKFAFVPEGSGFRQPSATLPLARMKHLVAHNYGNLIYGLFRRNALIRNGEVLWAKTKLSSLNEIAPLLLAAEAGEIVVLPEVGLYKEAPRAVYEQVVWENTGGRHPAGPCLHPRSAWTTAKYHLQASADIDSAIAISGLSQDEQNDLRRFSRRRLAKHFLYLMLGHKPRSAAVSS